MRCACACSGSSLGDMTAPDATSRMKSAMLTPYGIVKPSVLNHSAASPALPAHTTGNNQPHAIMKSVPKPPVNIGKELMAQHIVSDYFSV